HTDTTRPPHRRLHQDSPEGQRYTAKDGSLLQPRPGMPQPNSTRMYKAQHRQQLHRMAKGITAAPPAYQRLPLKAG
ncbi:Hypothetical predicted protein, partial [Pelobates cultripes]